MITHDTFSAPYLLLPGCSPEVAGLIQGWLEPCCIGSFSAELESSQQQVLKGSKVKSSCSQELE